MHPGRVPATLGAQEDPLTTEHTGQGLPLAFISHKCLSHPVCFCSARGLRLCHLIPSQVAFCSPHVSQSLPFYARVEALLLLDSPSGLPWVGLSAQAGGLGRRLVSHFPPARACHELSSPLAAEDADEYQSQKRAWEL